MSNSKPAITFSDPNAQRPLDAELGFTTGKLYWELDFDQMHGVWVSNLEYPGSYGRIAYREDQTSFWIMWTNNGHGNAKLKRSASCVDAKSLKLLPVEPDPWFSKCTHCDHYGLPVAYTKMQDRTLKLEVTDQMIMPPYPSRIII